MNKKLAAEHIDFADSEYRSLYMPEDRNLIVYLKSWDAKTLRITFKHAIQFSYQLGSNPSNLFEIENSQDLEKIVLEAYGIIPTDCFFRLFVMEDIDDFPFIQVVAESVTVVKEENIGNDKV